MSYKKPFQFSEAAFLFLMNDICINDFYGHAHASLLRNGYGKSEAIDGPLPG